MTLGENKKITLGLIEEYSPTNIYLTDDEDIATRLNLVYSTSYQELSQIKKILKTKTIKEIGTEGTGYEEYSLPIDMYQFKRILALDENNEEVSPDFKRYGKRKILINRSSNAKYLLDYYAYPSVITVDTPDEFQLEIDQDVQMVLPYAVANDILKVDPSSDYTAFYQEYQRKLNMLDVRDSTASATVEEGVL